MIEDKLTPEQCREIGARILDRFHEMARGGDQYGIDWPTSWVLWPRQCCVFRRLRKRYFRALWERRRKMDPEREVLGYCGEGVFKGGYRQIVKEFWGIPKFWLATGTEFDTEPVYMTDTDGAGWNDPEDTVEDGFVAAILGDHTCTWKNEKMVVIEVGGRRFRIMLVCDDGGFNEALVLERDWDALVAALRSGLKEA